MAERPEDLVLPFTLVNRIIKESLPAGAKVSKEASNVISKAASIFVLYTTSCANSLATSSNRKTIQASDVIRAMSDMEFDKFVKPLENTLVQWRRSQKLKKESSSSNLAKKVPTSEEQGSNGGDVPAAATTEQREEDG